MIFLGCIEAEVIFFGLLENFLDLPPRMRLC